MELDKKQTMLVIVTICAAIIFILIAFVYRPSIVKIRSVAEEFKSMAQEVEVARNMIRTKGDLQMRGHLLSRKELSLAIDEITKTGRQLNINFVSISPQEIEKLETSSHQRLPIHMELESEYKDLGLFLGALEKLEESIVTVRSFQIQRDDKILPLIKSRLMVDMYLQGEESE